MLCRLLQWFEFAGVLIAGDSSPADRQRYEIFQVWKCCDLNILVCHVGTLFELH